MGEATYTLEIHNMEKSNLPKIKAFIEQGKEAEDYWQKNRDMECSGNRSVFWSEFKTKFPDVVECIIPTGLVDGDCNNALAGKIDFADCCGDMEINISDDGILTYSAMVWHFATWKYFVKYLMDKYGGTEGHWWSDEY